MRQTILLLSILLGCSLQCGYTTGCDDHNPSAAQKCDTVYYEWCELSETCGLYAKSDCIAALRTMQSCAEVVSVSDTYDRCVSEIQSSTCPVAAQHGMPASCVGIFEME